MAIVAVWLTVLAPTVSRALPAFAFPDLGAWCDSGHDRGGEHHDTGDACGYCALFAQTPVLGGGFFVAGLLPVPGYVDATLPARPGAPSRVRYHAPTRGPPVAAHA